jgi:AraC-like DNA-binding protein
MARPATMAGVAVLDLLKALRHLGLSTPSLCRAVGLETGLLEEAPARVPTRTVTRLLALAAHRAKDPWIGLHAGARAQPRGPLFYLALSSSGLAESLRRAERFSGLVMDTLRLRIALHDDAVSIVFDVGDTVYAGSRHAMEYLVMSATSALRNTFGADFQVRQAQFRHRRAERHDEAARVFGAPIGFGRPHDRIVFGRGLLERTSRFASRAIGEELEKFAVALSARVTPRMTIADRVEQASRALLAEGIRPECGNVAKRLAMSSRTLQRRLAEDGRNFRDERDRVLWQVVESALANPSLKIEAIALGVGFSDAAAFSKAFRRSKGHSPSEQRELRGAHLRRPA